VTGASKISSQDAGYMQAALKLAQRGIGSVEPNPVVGCIIVKAGRVIGRGWHKKIRCSPRGDKRIGRLQNPERQPARSDDVC